MFKPAPRFLTRLFSIAVAALVFQTSAFAAGITVHEVYETAASGDVRKALTMMDHVLSEHPNSGQAHFVEAELLARAGDRERARNELSKAQQLSPGLPFAKPSSVQALQMQLNNADPSHATGAYGSFDESHQRSFPWGLLIMGGLIVVSIMLFISARQRAAMQAQSMPGSAPPAYGPGYGSPGYGPAAPGGGMGGTILGGLATGAAIGAGMVAGEALANRLMDGHDEHGSGNFPHSDMSDVNRDMGGNDFGLNDSSSWDAGSGGDFGGGDFGGGGGDWS